MTNPTPQPSQPTALTLEQQFKLNVINNSLKSTDDIEALRQMCFSLWQQQMMRSNLVAQLLKTHAAGEPCSVQMLTGYIQHLQSECASHGLQIDSYSAWSSSNSDANLHGK